MIGTLISILLVLIVLGAILWAIQQLLPMVPMSPQMALIVRVLLTLIAVFIVVWVIASLLGVVSPIRM